MVVSSLVVLEMMITGEEERREAVHQFSLLFRHT